MVVDLIFSTNSLGEPAVNYSLLVHFVLVDDHDDDDDHHDTLRLQSHRRSDATLRSKTRQQNPR